MMDLSSDALNGFFRMLAGIGMFLIGMRFLEDGVRHLAGRSFKLFLKRHTGNTPKAVVVGALVTAVLQSGSVVNLMVLAFVGSGVLRFRHALAVILGSNIGTTIDSWVLALAGFRFNIESVAYPLLGVAGLLSASTSKGSSWNHRAMLTLGIGALFVGLDLIKAGFSVIAERIDFQVFADQPVFVFILAGVLITALIQSSYATVALTLSALHAGAVAILPAMAVVLGAELGTTVKLLIASAGGSAAQRRVAWANIGFNAFTIAAAGLAILPISGFISGVLQVRDPLLALVCFQSLINVASALCFLPVLEPAARFLERRIRESSAVCRFIDQVPADSADLAIDAVEKEVERFLRLDLVFFRSSFGLGQDITDRAEAGFHQRNVSGQYGFLKGLHGEVHAFFLAVPKDQLSPEEIQRTDQLISSLRNGMYAAKSLHDSAADIRQLRESSNEEKYKAFEHARQEMDEFTSGIAQLLAEPATGKFDQVVRSYQDLQTRYGQRINLLYRPATASRLNEVEISTLLNFNRELYSGFKAMVWAVKDLVLTRNEAEYFSELPGFIR